MASGILGDSPEYFLFFTKRGGEEFVGSVGFNSLYYSRVIDGISSATVLIDAEAEGCSEILPTINPWEHEIAIVRNNEIVWQGPISNEIQYSQNSITITAQDILEWFNHRRVSFDRDYIDEDIGVIYKDLVDDALANDDSPNIEVPILNSVLRVSRSYTAARRQITYNALSELQSSGLDVTVVGRKVYIGAEEIPFSHLGSLPMGSYRGINIRRRGTDMSNDLTVTGAGAVNGGLIIGNYSSLAFAPEDIAQFGLLEGQTADFQISDQESADIAAKTRWDYTHVPVTFVQLTLQTWAPLEMHNIVPGALLTLADDSTHHRLEGDFRIMRADFQFVESKSEVAQIIVTNAGTFTQGLTG